MTDADRLASRQNLSVIDAVQATSFRAGDHVEIRSAAEILSTLDDFGMLDGVPFMPEMLPFVGQRFRVASRALKVCSAIGNTHMRGIVFLEQLRCDGSAHGGCQAQCRLFWKEEWLRPADESGRPVSHGVDDATQLEELAKANVRGQSIDEPPGGEFYRCQATEIQRAGTAADWRRPTQYVREVTSGNVGALHMTRVMTRALLRHIGKKLRIINELPLRLAGSDRIDGERLDLQPGEWVQIRSPQEIGRTLNDLGAHRGLIFTNEMAQHCGKRFQVKRLVDRLIDEGTGRMLVMKNDCVELDGLVCTGDRATHLWFCRRDLYPYWREAWLRRASPPSQTDPQGSPNRHGHS